MNLYKLERLGATMHYPDFIKIDRDTLEQDIANTFGTPIFVYDASRIESSYNDLDALCGGQVKIFFSLKANPNVSVAAQLRLLGAGAEVSSLTELHTALAAGYAPIDILFVEPFKTETELQTAIDTRIAAIVVDSFNELVQISVLSRLQGRRVPVLLRINPNFKMDEAPVKMGGVATQFGFSEDVILKRCTAFRLPGVEVLGIHVYNGSRVLSATGLASNIERILALSERLAQVLDIELRIVDIGGGWGVPYFASESPLDKALLAGLLRPIFTSFRQRYPQCRLITESGRFLVATSGTLLTRVHVLKESHGERFAVIDAGYNCFMAAAGMGSVIQRNFPIRMIDTGSEVPLQDIDTRPVHLAGPLCTPGDILARRLHLDALYESALIAIDCAGAYGPSASPVGFIGHGHPAEVLVVRQRAYLVRERDTPADLTRLQRNVFHRRALSDCSFRAGVLI